LFWTPFPLTGTSLNYAFFGHFSTSVSVRDDAPL
jgi:hypothetical protein